MTNKQSWAEQFQEEFIFEIRNYKSAEFPEGRLKDFISQLLTSKAEEYELALQAPMGISQWLNHGEKYGYDKFFIGKWKKELSEQMEGEKVFKEDYNREDRIHERNVGFNAGISACQEILKK